VLIELAGWRLLTDPTFDPAGGRYRFGWGTGSTKLAEPAIAADEIGEIDAVLLSHDHHDDNLDAAGRALLPRAGTVVTTEAGARRLGGNARGLAPWAGLEPLRYTMTADEAVELCGLLRPETVVPIHYEGWRHFRQGREQIEAALAAAPADLRERVHWLPIGGNTEIGV
jgi:L-ascorbate metabolism protein UlaG (beta-lactamase superfamily)